MEKIESSRPVHISTPSHTNMSSYLQTRIAYLKQYITDVNESINIYETAIKNRTITLQGLKKNLEELEAKNDAEISRLIAHTTEEVEAKSDTETSHLIEPTTTSSQAHLIKTLPKRLVDENWPYMRVKNTIKHLKWGSTRISHYDGLQLLAKKKGIHINQLLNMTLRNYVGCPRMTMKIGGRYFP